MPGMGEMPDMSGMPGMPPDMSPEAYAAAMQQYGMGAPSSAGGRGPRTAKEKQRSKDKRKAQKRARKKARR